MVGAGGIHHSEPGVRAPPRRELPDRDAAAGWRPFRLTGEFREVDPPERLAFTFNWEPPDPDDVETLVTLSFRDRDGSTAVALEQGAFKTEARRELHRDGWGESFDRLERLLAGRV